MSAGILPYDDDSIDIAFDEPEVTFDHGDSNNVSNYNTLHSNMSDPPHIHPIPHSILQLFTIPHVPLISAATLPRTLMVYVASPATQMVTLSQMAHLTTHVTNTSSH